MPGKSPAPPRFSQTAATITRTATAGAAATARAVESEEDDESTRRITASIMGRWLKEAERDSGIRVSSEDRPAHENEHGSAPPPSRTVLMSSATPAQNWPQEPVTHNALPPPPLPPPQPPRVATLPMPTQRIRQGFVRPTMRLPPWIVALAVFVFALTTGLVAAIALR